MRSIFASGVDAELRERIQRLNAEAKPRWGRLTASGAVCHVADAFRVPLGDIEAAPRGGFLSLAPVRFLLVHVLPWPRGKVETAPEYLSTPGVNWDADVQALVAVLHRFVERGKGPSPGWATHPAFGDLPNREWGWLLYKHTDHHLRQFGV
jgi:hypothetical protein